MIVKSAVISDCGLYRYTLSRTWDRDLSPMYFVMLNPSVADADIDDPTIRRCMGFARRENGKGNLVSGYGGVTVVNLFAYRATKPEALRTAGLDIHGPENARWQDLMLHDALKNDADIIAAWGSNAAVGDAGLRFYEKAKAAGVQLLCLGHTADRSPRHPLYVHGDAPIVEFSPKELINA